MIFQNNTTKLSAVVEENVPYFYDPLAYLKDMLESVIEEDNIFSEFIKCDYAEAYKEAGLINEAQYEAIQEGTVKNAIARICRAIRDVALFIGDTLVGIARRLLVFFQKTSFAGYVKEFKSKDLSNFKISTKAVNFGNISRYTQPGILVGIKTFGDERLNAANLYDYMTKEDIKANLDTTKDRRDSYRKSVSPIYDFESGVLKTGVNIISSGEAQSIEINNSLRDQYVAAYNNCIKAIQVVIKDLTKMSRDYRDLEKGFMRNVSKKDPEIDIEKYNAALGLIRDTKNADTTVTKAVLTELKAAFNEIMKVIKAGAIWNGKQKEEKNVSTEESTVISEADKDEDLEVTEDDMEDVDEDDEIEEFARQDEIEYDILMQEFDNSYEGDNTDSELVERLSYQDFILPPNIA